MEENLDNSKAIFRISNFLQVFCETTNDKILNKEINSVKFKILFIIYDLKNVSPSLICKKLNIVKSNVALFCKTLIKKGYIFSVHDEQDRRIIYYNLSPFGEGYVNKLLKSFEGFLKEKFKEKDLKNIVDKAQELNRLLKNGDV